MGVSGVPMVEPLSKKNKSKTTVEGSDVLHSFLISEKCPINLLGRDLPCKLRASIHCIPDGLYLTIPEDKAVQAMQFLKSTIDQLYCWTLLNFQRMDTFTVSNIQKIAKI